MTPRLAILSGGRAGSVEPINGAVASIGRHPTCQIRLDADRDTEVSNRHAVIQKKDGVWVARDLGSLQGTYLNGQRISAEQPLNDGDLLRLGASGPELQFLLSDRAQVAEPSRGPMLAQPATPALRHEELAQILEDEQAGQLARDAYEQFGEEADFLLVEATVEHGVAPAPLSKYVSVTDRMFSEILGVSAPVSDREAALGFYRDDLKLATVLSYEIANESFQKLLGSREKTLLRGVTFGVGGKAPMIGVIHYGLPSSAFRSLRGRSVLPNRGLLALRLSVGSVDEVARIAAGANLEIAAPVAEALLFPQGRVKSVLIRAPHGVLHHFTETLKA